MKEKLLILFLLGGLILSWGCSRPVQPTNGKIFTIEYDHQESYDVFLWGTRAMEEAFEQANTTLEFVWNDTLTDSLVKVDSLGRYYLNHVERDSTGVQALYEGYLCGIKAVCDNNGVKLDTIWGMTSSGPYGWSFICMDSDLPGICVEKTTIHELGHQRGGLSHLCLPDNTMNPAHNDSSCVMGQDHYATCTGKDLCWHPHFCENCRTVLRNVTW